MDATHPDTKSLDDLSYETALAELETIVMLLEGDDTTLESSLALYARGQALAQHCSQLLDNAELQVRQLAGETLAEFEAG